MQTATIHAQGKNTKAVLNRYHFNGFGLIGLEVERFLASLDCDANGETIVIPRSQEFLKLVKNPAWTHELSACQVEYRTTPCRTLQELRSDINVGFEKGDNAARKMGCRLVSMPAGPIDMPLDIYPNTHYIDAIHGRSEEVIRAACRCAGAHLHLSMDSMEQALAFSNMFRYKISELCDLGNISDSKRLELYKTMAPNWMPPHYESPEHFIEIANEQGFASSHKKCYHLIRIHPFGTVELRMFDMPPNINMLMGWLENTLNMARVG